MELPDRGRTRLPPSPLPGYVERCKRRAAIEARLDRLIADGANDAMVARARTELGEEGVRVLRGILEAREHGRGQRQVSLFDDPSPSPEVAPVADAFARWALDDLFVSAASLREVIPMLGFLGRAPGHVYNAMVVYIQRPDAREWKTRAAWERAGRVVREGARPLLTLHPYGPFRINYDISDTEGPPRDDGPGLLDAEGAVSREQMAVVRRRLDAEQLHVREIHPGESMASGFVSRQGSGFESALEMRAPLPAQFGTLCHELAHIFLGHLGPDPRGLTPGAKPEKVRWPERRRPHAVEELEAEAVAFVVCSQLGIVTPAPEYIAGYLHVLPEGASPGIEMIVRAASSVARLVVTRDDHHK